MIYCLCNNDNRYAEPNKIQFIGCNFENISQPSDGKVLYFFQLTFKAANITVVYAQVSIRSCLFYNTNHVHTMSFESFSFDDKENRHLSVHISNVTIAHSSINSHYNAINVRSVKLHIENLILSSILLRSDYIRTSIIGAIYSYVEFHSYNEFSTNTALGAISSSVIHLQENAKLNFTLNKFSNIIISPGEEQFNIIPNTNGILTCALQYGSKRENLDTAFKLEQKLNYSIVLYKNNNAKDISTFSTSTLMHCSWDSTSAFINSIPFHVNQKVIKSDSLVLEEDRKSVCLCTSSNTFDCYKGNAGPFYPGQNILLSFVLNNSLVNAAHIKTEDGNSEFTCQNEKSVEIQLESNECKVLYSNRVKQIREWCEFSLIARPLRLSVKTPACERTLYNIATTLS